MRNQRFYNTVVEHGGAWLFQTLKIHALPVFYAHQYFQMHAKFQSTYFIQQTTVC